MSHEPVRSLATPRHRHQGSTGHLQFLQVRIHFLQVNATQTSAVLATVRCLLPMIWIHLQNSWFSKKRNNNLRNIYSLWIAWTWLNIIKKVSDFSKLPDADCAFSAEQLKSLVWFVMTPTVSGYWGYVELEQWSRNLVDVGLSLGTGLLSDSGSVAPWSWGHLAWPPSWFD